VARPIDRKELKNPDQFVSFWTRVGHVLVARRHAVLGSVVGVVVAVILGFVVQTLMTKRAAELSGSFARIERVAAAELLPATGDAKDAKFDDGLPHFKTEKERIEAALKEADAFLAAHGGSRLRPEALLLKARFLLALDRGADAAGIYRELLSGGVDQRLRFLAQEGLGYAEEAAGKLDEAAAAFSMLADEAERSGGFYRDRALYHKARLLQKKGDTKGAEKVFRDILEKTPRTPLRDEIDDRLATLEKK
jgi:tetratricopeptide (TPR) repeat protein